MTEPIHIISLGAGVQSSTMALMAAAGELTPMPRLAVFADTGDESAEVYEWPETLSGLLPFPVVTGSKSRLSDNLANRGQTEIPCFYKHPNGSVGLGKRQCTSKWKIEVIAKTVRAWSGITRKVLKPNTLTQWIGISLDEVSRAKDSRRAHTLNRFPLLEKRMNRFDCVRWLDARGYKAPKSACVYCPYRSRSQWQATKRKGGEDWELVRKVSAQLAARGEYLTRECLPIEQVDFSTEEERGQLNMFNNECEGMCGV